MRPLWIALPLTIFVACGSDDHAPPVPPDMGAGGLTMLGMGGSTAGAATNGGKNSTSGGVSNVGGDGGDKGEGGDGGTSSRAPIVEILSPLEVLDPNRAGVITGTDAEIDDVVVTCKVTPSAETGATGVNSASVLLTALDGRGAELDQKAGQSIGNSQYQAKLTVNQASSGALVFVCTASDKSVVPVQGRASVSTFIDRGPTITPIAPVKDMPYGLMGATHFEFKVEPTPLWANADPGAQIATVTLATDGVDIKNLAADPKRPGYYTAEVNFKDTVLFNETPTGKIPLTITATNKRKPVAAVRSASYNFELDGTGPVTTITSPVPNAVIGGPTPTLLTFSVQDMGSGVDLNSIVVKLNNTDYRYAADDASWALVKPTNKTDPYKFSFAIDNTKFSGSLVQFTVNVQAQDQAANFGEPATLVLRLDNWSPLVSLDAPNARIISHGNNGKDTYCSASFDPLGTKAANDISNVLVFARFRAYIQERTNGSGLADVLWYSGIDPKSPHLYLQPDETKPIVIDTDGDGICDDIEPSVRTLASQELQPVTPRGAGNTNLNDLTVAPDVSGGDCKTQGVDLQYLCLDNRSDMQYVAGQHMPNVNMSNQPAVWAPTVGGDQTFTCTGDEWELAGVSVVNRVPHEGWICLAAEAADNRGNRAISPPLRVCFDNETTAFKPDCALGSTTPPSCTKACTPPEQDFGGGVGKPFLIGY